MDFIYISFTQDKRGLLCIIAINYINNGADTVEVNKNLVGSSIALFNTAIDVIKKDSGGIGLFCE
jgi:hypothetical protein